MNDITKTLTRLTMYDGLIEFGTANLYADPYSRQATTTVTPTGELNSVVTSPIGLDEKTKQLYRWFRTRFSSPGSTFEERFDEEETSRLIQQSRTTLQNMVTELDDAHRQPDIVSVMESVDDPTELSDGTETQTDAIVDALYQANADTHQVMVATTNQLSETLSRSHRIMSMMQTDMRRLLDYQLRVQFRLDTTKIELLNRTYLLNLKYYKFSEKTALVQSAELRKMNQHKGVRGLGSGLLDLLRGKGGFFDLFRNQISNIVVGIERDVSKRIVDYAGRGNALFTKRYESYEEYLDDIIPKGQKPLPEAIFNRVNPRINRAATYLSQYTDMTLRGPKDQKLRIKKAIWTNRSDNTLNVIIPKLLDDIRYYTSGGKAKRGYDDPFAGMVKPLVPNPGGGGGGAQSRTTGQSAADAQRSRQQGQPTPGSDDSPDTKEEKLVERVLRRMGEVNGRLRDAVSSKEGFIDTLENGLFNTSRTPSDKRQQTQTKRNKGIIDRQLDRVGRAIPNPFLRAAFQMAKNNPLLLSTLLPVLMTGGLSSVAAAGAGAVGLAGILPALGITGVGAAGVAGGVYAARRFKNWVSSSGTGEATQPAQSARTESATRTPPPRRPAPSTTTPPQSQTAPRQGEATDIYVRGDTEPRLTKAKFEAGKYCWLNPVTGQWHTYENIDEVDGDYGIYEWMDNGEAEYIVSRNDIRVKGLVDAMGRPVGSYRPKANKAGQKASASQPHGFTNPLNATAQQEADFRDSPHGPRLNSLQYKEEQAQKEKQNNFYQDVHDIRDSLKSTDKDGKPKAGFLEKLMTGMMGGMGGILYKALDWMFITPTKRMMKIGTFLFNQFLGPKSIMVRILSKGFGALVEAAIGRKLWQDGADVDVPGGKGKGKTSGKVKKPGKIKRVLSKVRMPSGRLGTVAKIGAGLGAFYSGEAIASSFMGGNNNESEVDDDDVDIDDNAMAENDVDDASGDESDGDVMDTIGSGLGTASTLASGAEMATVLGGGALASKIGVGTKRRVRSEASFRRSGRIAKATSRASGALKLGGRLLTRANPFLLAGTALYDGATGFADDDSIRNKFHNAPGTDIKTSQRLANAAANIMDLGGLGSWAGEGLANMTGIEAFRPDGSLARGIEKGFDIWSKIPGLNFPFIALDYANDKLNERALTNLTWIARLAMYGVGKRDSDLAKTILSTEAKLAEYVIFNASTGGIRVDPKAPLPELLAPFCQVDKQAGTIWFMSRFIPVWQLWQSALRVAGFKDLESYDNTHTPKTLLVAEQAYSAMAQLHPYPLDVVVKISNTVGLVPRETAEGLIRDALKQLANKVNKVKDSGSKSEVSNVGHLRSTQEIADGKSLDDSFIGKVGSYIRKQAYNLDEYMSPTPVAVKDIDISDLHKDESTMIDDLTLVRLGVYGNTKDDPLRVDTVLKLERYCEGLCQVIGGAVVFKEPVEKVFSLFAPAFRQTMLTKSDWTTWFNRRFLPVLKLWYSQVYKLRSASPVKAWVTLTDTNKFDVAHELVSLKILSEDGKTTEPVWVSESSPFPGYKSGTDSSVVDGFLANLETRVTRAKLKAPDAEKRLSQPLNTQNSVDNQLSPEERQRRLELLAKAAGGNQYASTGSASSYMSQYAQRTKGDAMPEFTQSSNTFDASYLAADTKEGFTVEKETAIKAIIQAFMKAGMSDPRILAFALANAHSETNFAGQTESLNYTPDALKATFRNFRLHPAEAERYGRTGDHPANEQAIGNIAYGGRMGNTKPGDGYKYRGRGYTQVTGRGMYAKVAEAIGDPEIVEHPEKVGSDPKYAAESAAGYFKLNPGIIDAVMKGNIQKAAELVGTERKGVARKMSYFPDYYRRLTEGDLKGLLTQSADQEEETTEQAETAASSAVNQSPPSTPEAQMAEEALGKTNVSPDVSGTPPTETGDTTSSSGTAPASGLASTAAGRALGAAGGGDASGGQASPANLARPGQPAPVSVPAPAPTQAQPPVQEAAPAPAPVPARKSNKKEEDKPVQVTLPDQVLNVNDEGVKQAIGQLATAINNLVTKQTGQAGGIDRRVNVGKR